MKINRLLLAAAAALMMTAGCQREEPNLGLPSLTLSRDTLTFAKEASEDTVTFVATRAWTVKCDAPWVAVDPDHGEASVSPTTVRVTVLDNSSYDRDARMDVSIGFTVIPVLVAQSGTGSINDLIIYSNDFDKSKAAEGTSGYPYLSASDVWMNEIGTGLDSLRYSANKVSARSNSNSNGNYSDYDGSGVNNLFFGVDSYFAILDLVTKGKTSFEFTFGTERYLKDDDKGLFSTDEFPVYVSIDGKKWAKTTYTYAGTEPGRWNVAGGSFGVPEGTTKMSILFKPTVASAYRIDDFKLVISEQQAEIPDFANGTEIAISPNIETGGSGDDGGASQNSVFFWNFKTSGQGTFTVKDVVYPSGTTSAWSYDSKYGMKATGYVEGANCVSESWLISPEIDLTGEAKAALEFQHSGNYFNSIENDVHVMISKDDGATWTELPILEYPDSWTFISSGKISLKEYLGSKIKIAFKYLSSKTKAGTWEIQTMAVLREEGVSTSGGDSGGGSLEGDSITLTSIGNSYTWTADTHATYKAGFKTTDTANGVELAYYKCESTTNPAAPSDSYIKVYKLAHLFISFTDGRTITGVKLTTSSATYTKDMKVGSVTAKANTADKVITWTGSTALLEMQASDQVRVTDIQIFYKNK